MSTRLLSLYGLKFNPFRPDVPHEALFTTPAVDAFLRRVEFGIADGGFAMVTGDPGTSKSVVLRLLDGLSRALPNAVVGTMERPQSRTADFYRELGDIFGVTLSAHNRWGGFKALRSRWCEHIASTLARPVLILDEAQEAPTAALASPQRATARLPGERRRPDLRAVGRRQDLASRLATSGGTRGR